MTNTKRGYHLPTLLLASTLWKGATLTIFLSCHFLLGLIRKAWARTGWPPQVPSVALLQSYYCACLYRHLFICFHRFLRTDTLANLTNLSSTPSFCHQKIFLTTLSERSLPQISSHDVLSQQGEQISVMVSAAICTYGKTMSSQVLHFI